MMRNKALWLENYWDQLTPWETHLQNTSIENLQTHKRYLSLAYPQRFTSNTETHSQRSHYSQLKKHPTFKSLSQHNQKHPPQQRSTTIAQNQTPKCSQPTMRAGEMLRQLRIKHFIMSGKQNRRGMGLKQKLGLKKQSNYILKQKYASLRYNSQLGGSRREAELSLVSLQR